VPTGIGDPTTVLVEVLITETVLETAFATYMSPLEDAKANALGSLPTDISVPSLVALESPRVGDAANMLMMKNMIMHRADGFLSFPSLIEPSVLKL